VNPVKIWEGIDTQEETGCNCLTKFAIHILSVVANSAGCERAFSHMGLVHTSIRSKLGVEKVRKATMVGMDIKQMHLEARLLHAQGNETSHFKNLMQPLRPIILTSATMISLILINYAIILLWVQFPQTMIRMQVMIMMTSPLLCWLHH
jgi:hAT family C-terminal dimerisation region